jgi:hypothetical protein
MLEIDEITLTLFEDLNNEFDKIEKLLNKISIEEIEIKRNIVSSKLENTEHSNHIEDWNSIFDKLIKDHKRYSCKKEIIDKSLFILNNYFDLYLAIQYSNLHSVNRNKINCRFFLKNVAIISHEILSDRKNILDYNFRKLLIEVNTNESIQDLDNEIKSLKTLQNKHCHYLKEIRNNLIGHRNKNGKNKQLNYSI